MTKEENIKNLKKIKTVGLCKKYLDSIDEAIKALEQQPSEDCVSRQAVLDKAYAYGNGLEPEGYCVNVEDIQTLPPVTPTQRWIPVSERLPEEETDVLICNANKEIAISRGSYSTEIKNAFIWYTCGWRFGEVLAWQPLPKPYEEK